MGAAGIELEIAGFVEAGRPIENPRGAVAPEGSHLLCDPGDRASVGVGGAEVVGGRKAAASSDPRTCLSLGLRCWTAVTTRRVRV